MTVKGGRCCFERQITSKASNVESCHHHMPAACACRARMSGFQLRVFYAQYGGAASKTDRRHQDHLSSWRFHRHGQRQTRSPISPTRLNLSVAWNILAANNATRAKIPVDGRELMKKHQGHVKEPASRRSRRELTHAALPARWPLASKPQFAVGKKP